MSKDQTKIFAVELHGGGTVTILDNMDVANLYFIEDIYSWCKCGKMILFDNMGIWEFLPLVGDEKLVLTYMSQVAPESYVEKTYEFKIFKIAEVGDISQGTAGMRERITRYSIEVFFIEEPHFRLHNPSYSKTWIDFLYYDIIKDIFKVHVELPGHIVDEDALEMIEYFSMSQRTPAQAIKWLGERMKGTKSGEPGYLFYSNTYASGDSYNMCTLEHLLKDAPLLTDPPGNPPGVYFIGGSSNTYAINTISNTSVTALDKTTINFLVRQVFLGYDIYRKYMIKREFEYMESSDHFTCMGNYTLYNGADLLKYMPRGKEILTGESGDKHMDVKCLMENMYWGEWVKQYCLQQLVSITVRGHVLRYAGSKIEINWLSSNTEDRFNKQMMGRYLVKSITHQFSSYSSPQYIQKMVLIKNGYFDTDADLTFASKTDDGNNTMDSDVPPETIEIPQELDSTENIGGA